MSKRVEFETSREGPKIKGLNVSGLVFHNRRMKYGYARVSTEDQNSDMQLKALQRAGCQKVFKDEGISGATTKRPAPLPPGIAGRRRTYCLETRPAGPQLARPRAMVEDFNRRGVHFRSLTEEINTTTAGGKLTFHIFAALAEFERGLIMERRPIFRQSGGALKAENRAGTGALLAGSRKTALRAVAKCAETTYSAVLSIQQGRPERKKHRNREKVRCQTGITNFW